MKTGFFLYNMCEKSRYRLYELNSLEGEKIDPVVSIPHRRVSRKFLKSRQRSQTITENIYKVKTKSYTSAACHRHAPCYANNSVNLNM